MKHRGLVIGAAAAVAGVAGALWYRRKRKRRAPITPGDLRNALTSQQGNVAGAARKLGISEKYAHDMLKEYPSIREEARRLRVLTTGKDIGRRPYKARGSKHLLP